MPIYEYLCGDCGSSFELLVLSKDREVSCPHCSSERVSKLFSTFALRSSGSPGTSARSSCSTCSGKSCSSCH